VEPPEDEEARRQREIVIAEGRERAAQQIQEAAAREREAQEREARETKERERRDLIATLMLTMAPLPPPPPTAADVAKAEAIEAMRLLLEANAEAVWNKRLLDPPTSSEEEEEEEEEEKADDVPAVAAGPSRLDSMINWIRPYLPPVSAVAEGLRHVAMRAFPALNGLLPSGEYDLSAAQVALLEQIAAEEAAFQALAMGSTNDKILASNLRAVISALKLQFTLLPFKGDSDEAAAFAKLTQEATTDAERDRITETAKLVAKEKEKQAEHLLRYATAHGIAVAYHRLGKPLASTDPIAIGIFGRLPYVGRSGRVFASSGGYPKPKALANSTLSGFSRFEV